MVDIIREKNKVDLAKDVADDVEALNETINTTENTFIIWYTIMLNYVK